jgi:hypothetical protein
MKSICSGRVQICLTYSRRRRWIQSSSSSQLEPSAMMSVSIDSYTMWALKHGPVSISASDKQRSWSAWAAQRSGHSIPYHKEYLRRSLEYQNLGLNANVIHMWKYDRSLSKPPGLCYSMRRPGPVSQLGRQDALLTFALGQSIVRLQNRGSFPAHRDEFEESPSLTALIQRPTCLRQSLIQLYWSPHLLGSERHWINVCVSVTYDDFLDYHGGGILHQHWTMEVIRASLF